MVPRVVPYCGLPPVPATLLGRWNLDPVLIASLAAVWILLAAGPWRIAEARRWRLLAGWTLAALLLTCPLCPLSVSLFSARIGQHMLLAMVSAPLVAAGLGGPVRQAHGGLGRNPLAAAGLFTVALWFWHAPGPYTLTFESTPAYWLMHISLYGSAVWLWRTLLVGSEHRMVQVVAASALTAGQMGLLAAAITFAGRSLYPPHALTTAPWGLTVLEDQQLGGAIMWAPAGAILVGALLWSLAKAMRNAEHAASARPEMGGI